MTGRLNYFGNGFGGFIVVACLILCANPASAQLFKKAKSKADPAADYAYKTHSTLGKKERMRGRGGDDPKFHFEKPKQSLALSKTPTHVSHAHFGHRRLPARRAIGATKFCKVCGIKH